MLEWLKLENVGPAPKFELDFAPRVNLITGDNGLGKSFLLDVAWWTLTGVWAHGTIAPNSSPAKSQPSIAWRSSSIAFGSKGKSSVRENHSTFNFAEQKWRGESTIFRELDFLIVQSKVDGEFSIYDSHRTAPFNQGAFLLEARSVWDGQIGRASCRERV